VRREYYTLTGISHVKLSGRVNADSEWLCLQSVAVCFLLKIWAERFSSVGDHGYERPVADGISIGRLLC